MRPTLLAGVLLCALTGALAASARRAHAQDAGGSAPVPKPEHIDWVESWEAGRAAARERGQLMLVYVHRTRPH